MTAPEVITTGSGVTLEGEAIWWSMFGLQKLSIGEHDLFEEIRDRFKLCGEVKLGRLRITIERLDDE
jgi:hypothetical protein